MKKPSSLPTTLPNPLLALALALSAGVISIVYAAYRKKWWQKLSSYVRNLWGRYFGHNDDSIEWGEAVLPRATGRRGTSDVYEVTEEERQNTLARQMAILSAPLVVATEDAHESNSSDDEEGGPVPSTLLKLRSDEKGPASPETFAPDSKYDYYHHERDLDLYQYSYQTEAREASISPTDQVASVYEGFSSYLPSPTADRHFFSGYDHFSKEYSNSLKLNDWNVRFRRGLKRMRRLKPTSSLRERIKANLEIMHMYEDFIHAATTYGKIIISEYFLPYEQQTIKPVSLGGLMGGEKFVVMNILFKFAVDDNGLFGSDYAAAKVAGNELRGLISYFNCDIPDLNLPLMALVDYRGFRLVAMSILPINKETIIYGSCDAGRNIHNRDPRIDKLMALGADIMRLKPHHCRIARSKSSYLYQEGADGRFTKTKRPESATNSDTPSVLHQVPNSPPPWSKQQPAQSSALSSSDPGNSSGSGYDLSLPSFAHSPSLSISSTNTFTPVPSLVSSHTPEGTSRYDSSIYNASFPTVDGYYDSSSTTTTNASQSPEYLRDPSHHSHLPSMAPPPSRPSHSTPNSHSRTTSEQPGSSPRAPAQRLTPTTESPRSTSLNNQATNILRKSLPNLLPSQTRPASDDVSLHSSLPHSLGQTSNSTSPSPSPHTSSPSRTPSHARSASSAIPRDSAIRASSHKKLSSTGSPSPSSLAALSLSSPTVLSRRLTPSSQTAKRHSEALRRLKPSGVSPPPSPSLAAPSSAPFGISHFLGSSSSAAPSPSPPSSQSPSPSVSGSLRSSYSTAYSEADRLGSYSTFPSSLSGLVNHPETSYSSYASGTSSEGEIAGTELLCSPADLEGHLGTDNRFYLLDFSRTQPPELPNKRFKNSHLSRLLRPEFVRDYYIPLCSDGFSGFIKGTPGEFVHNSELAKATIHLQQVTIPKFARELEVALREARDSGRLHKFRVTETAHSKGINCRHFGRLRREVREPQFKQVLLLEMIARCIKNNLRWKLREKMKEIALPLEEPYRRLYSEYFNLVFGNTQKSEEYWNQWLKKDLIVNFELSLTDEEMAPSYNLKRGNSKKVDDDFLFFLFDRVTGMMGIQWGFGPSRTSNFLSERPFDETDLESIGERVKHMNMIAHAQGYFYHLKGLGIRVEDPIGAQKFYQIAIEKFEEALNSDPNNKEILLSMALTNILMIEDIYANVPNARFPLSDSRVLKAEEYCLRAISAEPMYDSFSLFRYAQFLEKCDKLQGAEDYYLMALEADPSNAGCLFVYGQFLSDMMEHEQAEKFFKRASKSTEGQSQWPQWYH